MPAGWRSYRSNAHGLSVCHPPSWSVQSPEVPLPTVPGGAHVLLQIRKEGTAFPNPHIVVSTEVGLTTLGCPDAGALRIDGMDGRVCFLGDQFAAMSWGIGVRLPLGRERLPFVAIGLELPFQRTPDGRNPIPVQDRRDALDIIASLRFER